MRTKIKLIILIFFCLYSLFFFVGSTLAPIMASLGYYEISSKLYFIYLHSCHQQPDRSFWLMGYPMALCCRCYGFYLGVIIFSVLNILNKLKINMKYILILLLICIMDIFINYGLGMRINTGNYTRFFVGIIMGLIFTTIICYIFKIEWRKKYENQEAI